MKVSILLGSIRQERQSHRLAYYLENQMTKNGLAITLIDLKNYSLPLFGTAISDKEKKNVDEISACLNDAQAVLIVTPEYHSNIPAALENILEYCGKELMGKITGIASTSVTRFGGLQASNNLQITLLNLGTYPLRKRLLVPEIQLAFNLDNEPVQYEIKEQVEKFINELLSYAELLENKLSNSGTQ